MTHPTILLLLHVFIAAVMFLPSGSLAATVDTHIDTDRWDGFMKYATEMGLGAMIYVPSFIKIGSGIQKLIRGIRRHRQHGDDISLLLFFQNKESRLKIKVALGYHLAEYCG
jgi:hypothetical protein